MSASNLSIELTPEQQSEVAQWKTGETYQVTIEQTGPGQFNLVSVDGSSSGDDETGEPAPEGDETSTPPDMGSSTIPSKKPAVAILIGKK
jgi:hypothetical protein